MKIRKHYLYKICIVCIVFNILSCENFEPRGILEEELLDGPLEGLTYAESIQFLT